jgi:predicted DNA-binding helix-hairpin-helix protein
MDGGDLGYGQGAYGVAEASPAYSVSRHGKWGSSPRFMPAGQSTQMIVGATPETDRQILSLAENLYRAYDIRRVYYSAYIPLNQDGRLPMGLDAPPLFREHRLYQADWLFRFYGFKADEILDETRPNLDPDMDPKAAWALRHLEFFPVDVEKADYESLLRVPGLGPLSARKIIRARRGGHLSEASLRALGVVMKRARWFVSCGGKPLARLGDSADSLRFRLRDDPRGQGQMEFDWGAAPAAPLLGMAR